MQYFDRIKNFFSNRNKGERPPFEGAYIYILALFIAYAMADLAVLKFRPQMLPRKAPPQKIQQTQRGKFSSARDYAQISRRNIFDPEGKMPPALGANDKTQSQDSDDAPAVRSKLPLKLMGTIVHANPAKSVATINISNRNKTESVKNDEEIPSLLRVISIERRRVVFRNLNNRRKEFIDIPEDSKITFGITDNKPKSTGGINASGDFNFKISRTDLDKYTSDLPSILKQARMVPNILPGSGGQIDGFRFVSIKNDSVFAKLGFKAGDIIKGVNDDPVTSPTQAMEMYQALKSSNAVKLQVTRDGRDETFDYNIE